MTGMTGTLFDGVTYRKALDGRRLSSQYARVWRVMQDGAWRSLAEIASASGSPEASVSARLHDFRKARNGGHDVESRRRTCGTWEYRVKGGER